MWAHLVNKRCEQMAGSSHPVEIFCDLCFLLSCVREGSIEVLSGGFWCFLALSEPSARNGINELGSGF